MLKQMIKQDVKHWGYIKEDYLVLQSRAQLKYILNHIPEIHYYLPSTSYSVIDLKSIIAKAYCHDQIMGNAMESHLEEILNYIDDYFEADLDTMEMVSVAIEILYTTRSSKWKISNCKVIKDAKDFLMTHGNLVWHECKQGNVNAILLLAQMVDVLALMNISFGKKYVDFLSIVNVSEISDVEMRIKLAVAIENAKSSVFEIKKEIIEEIIDLTQD